MSAWLAYLPIPGLGLIPLYRDRTNRFVRFHVRQAILLLGLWYGGLLLLGLVLQGTDSDGATTTLGFIAMLWLIAGLIGLTVGATGAARSRYVRVRPVADLLQLMRR